VDLSGLSGLAWWQRQQETLCAYNLGAELRKSGRLAACRMFRCPDPCKLDHANCERWITYTDLLYGRALGSHGCNHFNRNTGLLEDRFAATPLTRSIAFSASRSESSISRILVGHNQLDMTYAERLGNFKQGDNGRVSLPSLKSAEILLAIAGTRFHILLCQAFFPTEAGKIPANQLAHIHARKIDVYIL
jgi:hypothetical protein